MYSSFLLTYNENIHFGRNQSFRDLSSVWKDDLAIRVSGKWFQTWRPNTLKFLSPTVKLLNAKNHVKKPCQNLIYNESCLKNENINLNK